MKNEKNIYGEDQLLYARLQDLLSRCGSGRTVYSEFLNPREQFLAERFFKTHFKEDTLTYHFWGGYPQAERRLLCLAFVDEWMQTDPLDAGSGDSCGQAPVAALSVSGSGFRKLTHRDYLGALLSLGLERRVLGDICILSPSSAVVLVHSRILPYLVQNLQKVSSDTVTASPLEPGTKIPYMHRFELLSLTVASLRLDCIVSAAAGISREKAKQMITSGQVEVDFSPVLASDFSVSAGACLSVKGVGRFLFDGETGSTKKGNYRIEIRKCL